MDGRGKSKRVCYEGLSQRLEEDRISQLPDHLLCQILSHLRTKDSVKTSILSTRWKSLWLCVPCLKLAYWDLPDFTAFKSFGDKFLDSDMASYIEEVNLFIEENEDVVDGFATYLRSWIDAVVKRKIQHLDVYCPPDIKHEMPLSLYTCETLVSLKLYGAYLANANFVSLPCLKTMHLKYIWYCNEAIFERLVSCCPVLEELKTYGCLNSNAKVFRVLSTSLKKLKIKIGKDNEDFGSGFVIDAPRLCCLSIYDKLSESFIINDMDSNAELDISLPFGLNVFDEASISSRRSSIRSFLPGISKVKELRICRDIFKLICHYSKTEPLPRFGYMSCLHLSFRVSDMKWLPTFLESCPNLKSLILVWNTNSKTMKTMSYTELCRFKISIVPECFLSSLEFVDIRTGVSGHFGELTLVRFFLENSTILKKLTLRLNHYCTNEKYIAKEILGIPRRSITSQVVIY